MRPPVAGLLCAAAALVNAARRSRTRWRSACRPVPAATARGAAPRATATTRALPASPLPYGMPPFATVIGTDEVAQLLSYVRGSRGNRGAPVSALEVARFRSLQ